LEPLQVITLRNGLPSAGSEEVYLNYLMNWSTFLNLISNLISLEKLGILRKVTDPH
jgi:hypothetical protein